MTEIISANPTNTSPIKSHRETLENRTRGCDAEARGTKNSFFAKAANSARSRIKSKRIVPITENNEKLRVFELDRTHLKMRIRDPGKPKASCFKNTSGVVALNHSQLLPLTFGRQHGGDGFSVHLANGDV